MAINGYIQWDCCIYRGHTHISTSLCSSVRGASRTRSCGEALGRHGSPHALLQTERSRGVWLLLLFWRRKEEEIYISVRSLLFFFLSHCGFQTIRSPTSRNPQNTLKLTVPAFVPSLARLLARTILQTELVEAVALPEAKQNVWHKRCRLSSLKAEKGSPLSDLQSAKRWTWLTVSLWRKMWSGRPLTLSRRAHR